jgi:U3 small nucleolar RNA-associated protein 7
MYDKRGTEIHKIRDHKNPLLLEYLPYHYLLTSVNKFGRLVYQDITHGQVVISYQTTSTPLCL